MKKVIFIMLSLLLAVTLSAQNADSSKFEALGLKLEEYYDALKHESLAVQQAECDFLIESTDDPVLRQFIAQDIYRHYINSPVMGAENVAVYVFDKWFAPGLVEMDPAELLGAKVYAEFNRRSLIGAKAQPLEMETLDGERIEIMGSDHSGKYSILYFYDVDCSKCKVESILLRNFLSVHDFPVDFYAIYVGDNRQQWESYAAARLGVEGAKHLWDPQLESDFQRKYGVLQTPRLFLVAPDGVILGRGLDVDALEIMLEDIFTEKPLEYGGKESEALFDGIFSMSQGRPSEGEVKGIADYIADKTFASGDTLMFRQMSGDYLYYLVSHAGEGMKEGLRYHIDKNILSQYKVWTSQDDSLKVVGMAHMMKDLLSKALPGTKVASVKVPGELYTWKGERSAKVRLDRLKGSPGIIIFYTEGCEICAAEKQAALELLSKGRDSSLSKSELKELRGVRVLMVNVDRLMADDPSLASLLMDAFDLSSLPYIIMTDRNGIILRRYISLSDTRF